MVKKIFILHGWATSIDRWKKFLEVLEKKGFLPVMLKIPGLTAPLDKPWKIEDYTEWLKEIVSKEKGKVVLLGHSNGGRICLQFASKNPQRIEHLFLLDSAGIFHNEMKIRFKRTIFKTITKLGRFISSSEKAREILYRAARESDYKNANVTMRETFRNLHNIDLLPVIPSISVPTTIIWGENDKITPLKDGLIMNNLIKNSRLIIIKNAKHSPHFTHPEEVSEKISDALNYEYF